MSKIISVLLFIFLAIGLAGCGQQLTEETEYQRCDDTDISASKEGNTTSFDESPATNLGENGSFIRQTQATENAKKYLANNQSLMENLAVELLKALSNGERLQYYPLDHQLLFYENESYKPTKILADHEVLETAAFMAGDDTFDFVSPQLESSSLQEKHCKFVKVLKNDKGEPECFVELVYCPFLPDNEIEIPMEQVETNWYLDIWYCE